MRGGHAGLPCVAQRLAEIYQYDRAGQGRDASLVRNCLKDWKSLGDLTAAETVLCQYYGGVLQVGGVYSITAFPVRDPTLGPAPLEDVLSAFSMGDADAEQYLLVRSSSMLWQCAHLIEQKLKVQAPTLILPILSFAPHLRTVCVTISDVKNSRILGYNVKGASGLFDLSLKMIKSALKCSDEEAMPRIQKQMIAIKQEPECSETVFMVEEAVKALDYNDEKHVHKEQQTIVEVERDIMVLNCSLGVHFVLSKSPEKNTKPARSAFIWLVLNPRG